jgi:hypothetical protein
VVARFLSARPCWSIGGLYLLHLMLSCTECTGPVELVCCCCFNKIVNSGLKPGSSCLNNNFIEFATAGHSLLCVSDTIILVLAVIILVQHWRWWWQKQQQQQYDDGIRMSCINIFQLLFI